MMSQEAPGLLTSGERTEGGERNADVELSADAVAHYLRSHPDFFLAREDVLAELSLPHNSGRAISLVERQVHLFREQRDTLQRELAGLVAIARQNDRLFEKTKRLLVKLLEAGSLADIAAVLDESLRHDFGLDASGLVLFSEQALLPQQGSLHFVTRQQADEILGSLLLGDKALCGRFRASQLQLLFPGTDSIGSAAIIPLRSGELLGALAVGSKDAAYFESGMGSLFLSYISDTLSRILPPLLQVGPEPSLAAPAGAAAGEARQVNYPD